jgi:hypothetical protein
MMEEIMKKVAAASLALALITPVPTLAKKPSPPPPQPFPLVYDSLGNVLGVFAGVGRGGVTDEKLDVMIIRYGGVPYTIEYNSYNFSPNEFFYYTTPDCTGTIYVEVALDRMTPVHLVYDGMNTLWAPDAAVSEQIIIAKSYGRPAGCGPTSQELWAHAAKAIDSRVGLDHAIPPFHAQ